jgi:hypothetical protein
MFFFLMPVVMALLVFVIVAPILGFSRQGPSSLRFMTVFPVAGISLIVVRVTACWAVYYLTRTGQRDINLLPLELLTLPEALLLPESGKMDHRPRNSVECATGDWKFALGSAVCLVNESQGRKVH